MAQVPSAAELESKLQALQSQLNELMGETVEEVTELEKRRDELQQQIKEAEDTLRSVNTSAPQEPEPPADTAPVQTDQSLPEKIASPVTDLLPNHGKGYRRWLSRLMVIVLAIIVGWGFIVIGGATPPAAQSPVTQPSPVAVNDTDGLVAYLESADLGVTPSGSVSQPFFSVIGSLLKVSGEDVQVFEYTDATSADTEAALIAPDGNSIDGETLAWSAPPHFYAQGKIIALYLGTDSTITAQLERALGPQIAGARES